ncbi:hypothetical protein ABC733_18230 [Mangrovibacter sp. SLW1]
MPGSTPSATLAMVSDSATSTTHSAVAPGSIIIRDATGQQQDVADLSRDTAGAQNALENNFDQKKYRTGWQSSSRQRRWVHRQWMPG